MYNQNEKFTIEGSKSTPELAEESAICKIYCYKLCNPSKRGKSRHDQKKKKSLRNVANFCGINIHKENQREKLKRGETNVGKQRLKIP